MKFQQILLATAVFALQNLHSSAATLYVDLNSTNPTPPYADWSTAATNIQDAIDASVAGDFIVVSNGTYNSGGRAVYGTATNRVTIDKAVTVQSVNGPTATMIQGSVTTVGIHCAYLTNGAALNGFTLTNGSAAGGGGGLFAENGGGVWCESSSAVVSNCYFIHNMANQYGGGAFRGTLVNCILTNNSANYGGGACSNVLISCTLVKNTASVTQLGGGGAIYSTLSNCVVVANTASSSFGGGAYFSTLTSCIVSNNFAQFGGGVYMGVANYSLISSNRASSGGGAYSNVLVNCVLRDNYAATVGGAYGSIVMNCTVVSNVVSAAGTGKGAGLYGGSASNSIVCYNLGTSQFLGSMPMYYCCTTPLPTNGVGNITNEPAFIDLMNGDFHLQSNSPCINSGNNSYITNTTDLDGNPRIVGGTVDIGAYEFQSPSSILSYAWAQQYGLPTDGSADYSDSDGDGMNNWQEWRAGTVPTNALSLLQMLSPIPTNSPSGLVVTWQSVNTRTYYLQSSINLGAQPAFSTIRGNIVGQAGTTSFTDTSATNVGPYFYRVGVQ